MRKHFGEPVRMVQMKEVLEDGRYVTKAVVTEVAPQDNFKDYRMVDFAMDHLKAIGAEKTLKDCGTNVQPGFGAIDKLSGQITASELQLNEN